MKFDELEYPDCGRCPAKKLNAYSKRVDADGNVKEVVCFDCDNAESLAQWKKDHRLTSRLILTAALKSHSRRGDPEAAWLDINESSERVRARVKDPKGFERAVWFGGLQAAVRATRERGLSANIDTHGGKLTLTTYCLAGRCMVQIESDAARLTLITAEDEAEAHMGVQGIDATEGQAIDLLNAAQRAWCDGAVTMASAPNVGMG